MPNKTTGQQSGNLDHSQNVSDSGEMWARSRFSLKAGLLSCHAGIFAKHVNFSTFFRNRLIRSPENRQGVMEMLRPWNNHVMSGHVLEKSVKRPLCKSP